jgi:hypothetical protein
MGRRRSGCVAASRPTLTSSGLPEVESVLACPLSDPNGDVQIATAVLPAGERTVRTMLAGLSSCRSIP